MTPEQIRSAIGASPSLQALAPNTAALAAAISESRTKPVPLSRAIFARWAAKTGVRSAIEDHATAAQSPLRSIALALLDVLRGAAESLDFTDADNLAMLDAWVQAGEITTEQRDALLALAIAPDPVSEFDVRCAIYADDGTLRV